MKVAIAQINPTIGDFAGNGKKIGQAIEEAKAAGGDLVLFSEMALTGYPPEDFLLHREFIAQAEKALLDLVPKTSGIAAIIGTVREGLYNSAAILAHGKLLGYQDKALLPTYDVFDEKRYFRAAEHFQTFEIGQKKVAITICEDIWQHSGKFRFASYPRDPVKEIAKLKPDLICNLSASPYHFRKYSLRQQIASDVAMSLGCPLILCNQVGGNDSLIFDGYSFALNAQGELVCRLQGFEEDFYLLDTDQMAPCNLMPPDPLQDLHQALVLGLRDYFCKLGFKKACLGLSGGIDSALVACLATEALGKENILAVAMPSRYSSPESLSDAKLLAHNLDIPLIEIPIEAPFQTYLSLLTPFFEGKKEDTTEENLQARIRGILLMALSNKHGYLVLSTGNKSEFAMGYSTLYGDMTGGLAVISDLTKEKVYQLSYRLSHLIPRSILEKAPSAELRAGQKDADTLPPYPIVDVILEAYIEQNQSPAAIAEHHSLPLDLVKSLIRKIHQSEYKRRQAPPGLRVTEKAFSIGRRFPIVQKFI